VRCLLESLGIEGDPSKGFMAAKTRSARTTRTSRRPPRKRSGATGRLRKRSAKAVAPDVVQAALAAFAHEVRTPLTGILAISDLLATSDLGERERGWANALKSGAEHLAAMTTLIVDAAKADATGLTLRHEPFSPRRVPILVTMTRPSRYGCSASRMIWLVTCGP